MSLETKLLNKPGLPVPIAATARSAISDHWLVRWIIVGLAFGIMGILIVLPLANVFYQALGGDKFNDEKFTLAEGSADILEQPGRERGHSPGDSLDHDGGSRRGRDESGFWGRCRLADCTLPVPGKSNLDDVD